MKVCLLVGAGATGGHEGVVDYAERLCEHLAGHVECAVLSLPGRGITGLWRFVQSARGYPVVHVQLPCYGWRYSLLPALVPLLLARRTRLVATFHEWEFMHPWRRKLLRGFLARASRVLFVSSLVREQFLADQPRWRDSGKVATIPIGVNVRYVEPDRASVESQRQRLLGRHEEARLLVHFGTLYEGKQPERLLDAIVRLKEAGVPSRLALVGSFIETADFSESAFRSKVEQLGLTDQVAYLGSIDDESVLACVIAASDAVVGLYSDGLSMRRSTFWYAAQFGVPIVSTVPADRSEFDERTDVLGYPGLSLVPIEGDGRSVADAIQNLPPFTFRPFEPLEAPSWDDIAARHAAVYRSIA